ncbi:MAG: DNA topoisomerase VI subunit B [Candidatus Altiarchaeales archaeon]|nr:DNA topoisomerase VI subunit B [Candidatus Altiarchaeales archaeon]MBD3415812.1 DNA topoisomerase VI subunit B [Candidatus Altiarchaeales archaeon]
MARKKDESVKERSADELFKDFKEVSITEFFRKNKAHLGYSGKLRSLTTVIHELVTNSLDACEEAGILPDIEVTLKQMGSEHYRFTCRDNGPGIPEQHISNVFGKMLAGTKFHRSVQLRGQQGIGVAGVTLFSQMTTGKPVRIITSTGNGKVHDIQLMVDVTKNRADILEDNVISQKWRGTEIQGELKGVLFNLGERSPYEYIRRSAIANPHLKITFVDPEGRKSVFDRTSKEIPKPPKEMKPHPKGMDTDELINRAKRSQSRRVSSFLETEFSRISKSKADEIQGMVNFDLKKNPRKMAWAEAEEITKAFEEIDFMAPPVEGLRPIGEEQIDKAVLKILKPEFSSVLTRSPTVYGGGVPFQVEVAIAYGGNSGRGNSDDGGRAEIMRFANRTPLLFDTGACAINQAVQSVDWKRYDIRDFDNSPVTIFVNLVSVHVPYTSAGKQSVSSEDELVKEIRMALMDVGRRFHRYHSRMRREIEKEARMNTLIKYSSELAAAVSKLARKDEEKLTKSLQTLITKKLKIEYKALESEDKK